MVDLRDLWKLSVAGIIIAVVSFVSYVFVPNGLLIAAFAIGIILLIAGYIATYTDSRNVSAELDAESARTASCVPDEDVPGEISEEDRCPL